MDLVICRLEAIKIALLALYPERLAAGERVILEEHAKNCRSCQLLMGRYVSEPPEWLARYGLPPMGAEPPGEPPPP